jgi:segregation and condensation protein A
MRIKAKTLLPRPEINDQGEEIDPREELIRHLIEYKRYKSVVEELAQLETQRLAQFQRGNVALELQEIAGQHTNEMELHTLDLYKLMRVFDRVMNSFQIQQTKPKHTVIQYPFTIEGQREFLLKRLEEVPRISFEELLMESPGKIAAVFNFLAILDLVQLGKMVITVGEGFNNFWLTKPEITT